MTIGKSIMSCYAFLLYFQMDNMESIIPDKVIQHRLYHSEYITSRLSNNDSDFVEIIHIVCNFTNEKLTKP
uniref:Uncharacterized protein n=1 Tax=Amphimedon queenslandica TaxID=400682 RepID=A0A1X7VTQ5_AMPQE